MLLTPAMPITSHINKNLTFYKDDWWNVNKWYLCYIQIPYKEEWTKIYSPSLTRRLYNNVPSVQKKLINNPNESFISCRQIVNIQHQKWSFKSFDFDTHVPIFLKYKWRWNSKFSFVKNWHTLCKAIYQQVYKISKRYLYFWLCSGQKLGKLMKPLS